MNEWMDGCSPLSSLLPASSFAASATQFFSSRAAVTTRLAASSRNPAMHKSSTMATSYLACSCYICYNACSNLQLQSRWPKGSQHHYNALLCAAVPVRLATKRLQTRMAGALHQIGQCSGSADSGDSTSKIRRCSERASFFRFYVKSELSLQSGAHVADLLRACQFLTIFDVKPSSRYNLVNFILSFDFEDISGSRCGPVRRFLLTTFADRDPTPWTQRPYTSANPGAIYITRKKHRVSWIHTLPNC